MLRIKRAQYAFKREVACGQLGKIGQDWENILFYSSAFVKDSVR